MSVLECQLLAPGDEPFTPTILVQVHLSSRPY